MGDADNSLPSSKKRAAGRELNRDRPDFDEEEDASEQGDRTFKRASDDVLATRRIVKVRRNQGTSAPASNPFAGIRLVVPAAPVPIEKKDEQKVGENEEPTADAKQEKNDDTVEGSEEKISTTEPVSPPTEEKEGVVDNANVTDPEKGTVQEMENDLGKEGVVENTDNLKKPTEPMAENGSGAGKNEDKSKDEGEFNANLAPLSSFQQLSSTQNAFTGVAGTGFSTSTFLFGSVLKGDQTSFGFGLSNNGNSSMFPFSKGEGSSITSLQEVVVETGEENERAIFNADSILFEYLDGSWKERGQGEIKVNVSKTECEKVRILMRTRGNYRLVLNASLYPEMKLANMDKKGVTFACVNGVTEGKGGLSTFALKFKDASIMEEFRAIVIAHKGKEPVAAAVLKTPENSPEGSSE